MNTEIVAEQATETVQQRKFYCPEHEFGTDSPRAWGSHQSWKHGGKQSRKKKTSKKTLMYQKQWRAKKKLEKAHRITLLSGETVSPSKSPELKWQMNFCPNCSCPVGRAEAGMNANV